jgi:hypothetical protein
MIPQPPLLSRKALRRSLARLLHCWCDNIRGSGADIIGLFTLIGTIEEGKVAIVKQYLGQHSVDYLGTYDGEGTMHGMWRIGFFGGKWMIKVVAHAVEPDEAEIPEWRPVV